MLKMITPEKALELVMDNCPEPVSKFVSIDKSLGMVLAQDVSADRDYPPFYRAMMDGFAVKACDAGKSVTCNGIQGAGQKAIVDVKPGFCLEIMTGAACPQSADLVVPVENVQVKGDQVTLPAELRAGDNIAAKGFECGKGQRVASPGDEITPLVIANMACYGLSEISVYSQPKIALISTGDELAKAGERVNEVQIRDSNGPMLEAMAIEAGLQGITRLKADDNMDSLAKTISEASEFDIVVMSGGVSMGKYDYVPLAVEATGAEMIFHKSTQKPGKPMLFARRGRQLFFGLPGNPLASHMCFHRYIEPVVRKLMGKSFTPPPLQGKLTEYVTKKGKRTFFQLVKVKRGADGSYLLTPLIGKGSADIHTAATAEGYIKISNDRPELHKDEIAEFEFTGEKRWRI